MDWHLLHTPHRSLWANTSPAFQGGATPVYLSPLTADSGSSPFLLWFLAASARFLHVYHCNQQSRPEVSQAAWNKAAWTTEHKIGEAFHLGYRVAASVFSLNLVTDDLVLPQWAKRGHASTPPQHCYYTGYAAALSHWESRWRLPLSWKCQVIFSIVLL